MKEVFLIALPNGQYIDIVDNWSSFRLARTFDSEREAKEHIRKLQKQTYYCVQKFYTIDE